MSKKTTGTEKVTICIDLGSSLTKVVWSIWSQENPSPEINFLTMEPETMQCNDAHLDVYRSKRINLYSTSTEDTWIKLEDGECSFAVGFLASTLLAETNLKALKYESALYKILAVLGAIAEQLQSRLAITLTILLPWSEWNDQGKLKEQVQQAVKSFWFRGKRMSLRLQKCMCLPEGAGVTLNRYSGLTQSTAVIVTLVFGHRNISCLVFQRGILNEASTTDLGFYRLIDKVMELTSGQTRKQLSKAIYQLGYPIDIESPIVAQLCKSQLVENQQREKEEVLEAIHTAQQYYWELINQWLLAKIPRRATEMVIAGGASKYLYNRLQERFSDIPTYWGTDWQELIENTPQFHKLDLYEEGRGVLAFRLVDAYACHYFQLQISQHLESQKTTASPA